MSKQASKIITIDVAANTLQAEKELKILSDNIKKIQKDGIIQFKTVVETSKLNELNKMYKDKKIKLNFDLSDLDNYKDIDEQLSKYPDLQKIFKNSALKDARQAIKDDIGFLKDEVRDQIIATVGEILEGGINIDETEDAKKIAGLERLYNFANEHELIPKGEDILIDEIEGWDELFEAKVGQTLSNWISAVKNEFKANSNFNDDIIKQGRDSVNEDISLIDDYRKDIKKYKELSNKLTELSINDLEYIINDDIDTYIESILDKASSKLLEKEEKRKANLDVNSITDELENDIKSKSNDIKIDIKPEIDKSELNSINEELNNNIKNQDEKNKNAEDSNNKKNIHNNNLDKPIQIDLDISDNSINIIKGKLESGLKNIPITFDDSSIAKLKTSIDNICKNINADSLSSELKPETQTIQTNLLQKEQIKKTNDNNDNIVIKGVDEIGSINSKLEALSSKLKNLNGKINIDDSEVDLFQKNINQLNAKNNDIDIKINILSDDFDNFIKNVEKYKENQRSIDISVNTKSIEELDNSFITAFNNIEKSVEIPKNALREMNAEANKLKDVLETIGLSNIKNIDWINKDIDKKINKKMDNAVSELIKINKKNNSKNSKDSSNLEKEKQNEIKKEEKKLSDIKKKKRDKVLKKTDDFKLSVPDDDNIDKEITSIDNINLRLKKSLSLINNYKSILNSMDLNNVDFDSTIESLENEIVKAKKLVSPENYIYGKNNNKAKLLQEPIEFNSDLSAQSLEDRLKAIRKYYKEVKDIDLRKLSHNKGDKTGTKFKADYLDRDDIHSIDLELVQFEKLENSAKRASVGIREATTSINEFQTSGQKWIGGFTNKIKNLTQYITGIEIVQRAWMEIKEGFSFVKDLDSLMTTIYQTSDITRSGLDELSQSAINQARDLGVATEQVSGAIEVYAAYGETVDSLLNKSAPTTMLAKAAGADVSEASSWIMGVTQQYEELEGKESKVVNAYEKIAANLKIDFTEGIRSIAEGTQIAGSVAKSAGIDFNTFAASIGTVAERTRQDGKSIANAYKTILARTSRSKVPGEDVSAEERGQAAKALANIGINVYDENGKYQSFGKTLDQLSEKWDKLTDSQRANVSEGLAGVRNLNILTSIVETWNDAKSLSKQVEEDPNYYLEVQEKSMDSLQSKMDTLKASMQNFWYNLLDVGAISEGIGLITKLSDAIGGLLSQIKLLPMVGNTLGISTVGGIGIVISQMIDNIIKERGKLKDEYGSAGLFGGFKTGFKSTFSDLNTLGLKKGAVLKDNQTTATITSLFADGKQASGLASGIKNVWTNMTGLSKAVVGTVGAFAAFEAVSKIFDKFTNTSKELKESVNSANAQFESQRKRITDNKNSLDSIKSEWSKLSEGVDLKTNENISLTSDEYERFIELNSEIANILPQTVAGMDNQGNAILNLSGSVSQLNNEYEKLLHQESEKRFLDNVKTYADEAKRLSGEAGFWDKSATILDGGDVSDIDGYEKTIDLLDKVSKINDVGVLKKYLYGDSDSGLQAQFSLPEVRYVEKTFGVSSTTSQEEWNEIIRTGQLKSALDEQKQILSSGANSVKNAMQDYLTFVSTVGGEYDKVNNKIINAASKLIGGLSDKTVIELGKSETQIRSTVTGFIDKLQKDPNLMSAFEKITSIDSSSSLNEIINSAGMVDVLESQLGLNGGSLNKLIGIDAKSIKKSYDKASKSVAKFNKVESKTGKILEDNKDLLDEFIDKNNINSEAELDKLKSLIDKSDTWQDVLNDWVLEGLDFENIDTELESLEANLISVKNAFDKLNKAIQESNSSSGMSGESIDNLKSLFSGLKGYDADKLFEDTYGGVRANPQELAKLTKEYKQTNYSKYTGEVADLEKKYAELSVQIDKSSSAVERNQALQERDKIKEKIKDAEMLQSQYEGLTNAVNMWQQAQSRGDEGDLYESVRGGFDEAKKLFDEGWIGDDRFQAFTQMFSKEDLSGAGSDIYEQVFANSLPKMERWFAEGTQGANNFLNDIAALNEGLVDAQGNVNWDKLPDMDTLADQLGVDVSLINTMFKALNRAGADLDFSEAADRLRGLRTEVENVGKGLDDATREKYTVDLDVENAEDIDAAIKQAEALKEEAKGNADATEYLSKQIDYLHAKAGEKTTMEVDIYSEEGIKNLNKDLDVLNSKLDEDHKLKIEWDKLTPENIKSQIDSATNAVRGFVNEDGKLDIETDGAQEALNILQALQQKAWDMNAESNILLRVDKSQVDSSTAQVIDDFAEIQAAAHNLESLKVTPGVEDSQLEKAKTKLQTLINEFNSSKGGMTATMDLKNLKIIDLASGKIDNLSSKLTSLNASSVLSALGVAENAIVGTQLPDKELTVKTKLIKGETETWKPSPKTQTVTAQLRKGDVNTWIPARRTQYVDVVKVSKGGNKVNGNANVNGNASLWQRGKAFAKGTWGAVKNSVALTGELGRELIVRGNEWFTIGNNGAEFNEIKKGDIVFNHY